MSHRFHQTREGLRDQPPKSTMAVHPHGQFYDPALRSSVSSNDFLPLASCRFLMTLSAWAMAGLFLLFTMTGLVYLRTSTTQAHTDPEGAASWASRSSISTSKSPASNSQATPPAAVSSHPVAQDRGIKLEDRYGVSSLESQYKPASITNPDAEKVPSKLPAGMSRSDSFQRFDGCRRHTIIVR